MSMKTRDTDPASDPGASDRRNQESHSEPPELEPPTAEELAAQGLDADAETAPAEAPGAESEAARTFKDRWLRAEAELQNFRRRAQREVEEARRFAEERGYTSTIEHLDDLERALEAAPASEAPQSWLEGVALVAQRMRDHLTRNGVKEIEARGAPFDPAVHEAMLEVDPPAGLAPGAVVQVVRKGYEHKGRVLRPARVIVARRAD